MRKFSLQAVGLLIIFFAVRLVAAREPAAYVLRDGGLLILAGMVLFAANARGLWRPPRPSVLYYWSVPGMALFITGCLAGVVGALLYLRQGPEGATPLAIQATLWFLGMGMMVGGAAWHGRPRAYRTPRHRWTVDEAGQPVRQVQADDPKYADGPADLPMLLSRNVVMSLALLIVLLGATLRMWQLLSLPEGCVSAECVLGLRLRDPTLAPIEGNPLDPFGWIAQALYAITQDSLLSLRLAGAAVGIITLPVFFGAATQVSQAGGALLATLLLVLNPWHIAAGRSAESWLVLFALLTVALWAVLRALHNHRRGWWVLAGLATGALALSAPALRPAIWLFGAWIVLLGFLHKGDNPRSRYGGLAIFAVAVLIVSLPTLRFLPLLGALDTALDETAQALLKVLLQGESARPTLPVMGAGAVALALAGLGVLVRWGRRTTAQTLLGGLLIFGLALLVGGQGKVVTGGALLSLLPFFLLAAAVAADQLVRTFASVWLGVLRPMSVALTALLLVALFSLRPLWELRTTLANQAAIGADTGLTAMTDYLLDQRQAGNAPFTLLPPALYALPAAQLRAGEILGDPNVAPLNDPLELLLSDTADRDLQLLLTTGQYELQDLLNEFYPANRVVPVFDDEGRLLFTTATVDADALRLRQGLAGAYFADVEGGELAADQRDGPLFFDWTSPPGLSAPLRVEWAGSLLAAVAGDYRFAVRGVENPGTLFALQLDDEVVLDSSLGILETEKFLARGPYRLTMRYISGEGTSGEGAELPPLLVTWTPPGGEPVPIPREALISPALPEMGLLGIYYPDRTFSGPPLTVRKDLIVGARDAAGTPAESVEWRGKLGAARSGEYLLAVVADGVTELILDDATLLDSRRIPAEESVRGYAESLVYLDQGWHDLTLRFVPDAPDAGLRLLWQPPGGVPGVVPPRALSPHAGELEADDLSLPPPPSLSDPGLGDDTFALTQAGENRAPQQIMPPQALPALPLTPTWQTNAGCGVDLDQLAAPHGVVIDADAARIYVADTGNQRIVVYNFEGEPLTTYADERLAELSDLALGANGALLALDAASQLVYRIDPVAETVEPLALRTGFYRPRGLDVDAGGVLYVADTGGGRVAILGPDGDLLGEYGGSGTTLGQGQPVDVLATQGALWAVTSEDGRLTNLTNGGSLTAIARAVSIDGPHLAGLADGSFLLSDPVRRIVYRFSAQGQPLQQLAYPDLFLLPTGIAAAEIDDQLFLAIVDTQQCSLSLWNGPTGLLVE